MKTNNKGVTLIALVITIIVLLILAGVSIATLMGPNGIINNAKKADKDTRNEGIVEQINVELQGLQIKVLTGEELTVDDLKGLKAVVGEANVILGTLTPETGDGNTAETLTKGTVKVIGVPAGITLNSMGLLSPDGIITPAVVNAPSK